MSEIKFPPRPAPQPQAELEQYWAAAAQGYIGLGRCDECGQVFLPPQKVCPRCWSSTVTVVASTGRGRVEAVSVVHRHSDPAFKARAPYAIVLVRLHEGVALTSTVVGPTPDQIAIGDRVVASFEPAADGTVIPIFVPEES